MWVHAAGWLLLFLVIYVPVVIINTHDDED